MQRRKEGIEKLPIIVGFDQNRYTVNTALAHIANAGLQKKIHVERRDIEDAQPAESWQPGLLICNPPYGERLGDEEETAELYTKFGNTLKSQFVGWKAAMIISNMTIQNFLIKFPMFITILLYLVQSRAEIGITINNFATGVIFGL